MKTRQQDIYYQGEPGAFSEAAIKGYFPEATAVGMPSFDQVFDALNADRSRIGLLPIENAYRGPVYEVLDLLSHSTLKIRAEVVQPVDLALLVLPGTQEEQLRKVRSHPQALMQSRGFWRGKGLDAEVALDTAGSARELAQFKWPEVAAIASPRAAEIYGLDILASAIQDHMGNRTRFWLLTHEPINLGGVRGTLGETKVSVIFDLRRANQPGSLVSVLQLFGPQHGLNLTKIESRPRPGTPFGFRFWLDIAGTRDKVESVLRDAEPFIDEAIVLGEYPIVNQ